MKSAGHNCSVHSAAGLNRREEWQWQVEISKRSRLMKLLRASKTGGKPVRGRYLYPTNCGLRRLRLPAGFATALLALTDASGSLLSRQPVGRRWLGGCRRVLQLQAELPFQISVLPVQIRYLPVLVKDSPVQFFKFVSQSLVFQLQLALVSLLRNLRRPMSLPRCPQTFSLPGFVSKGQAQMHDSSDLLKMRSFRGLNCYITLLPLYCPCIAPAFDW